MAKSQGFVSLKTLNEALAELMQPQRFKDYCPNGLQVEGKPRISKLVTGVTASLAFLTEAIERNADAVLVHHGYFFRGEDERITGQKRLRIAKLIKANVSLFAYHLPLDVHSEFGNNVQLGAKLGFEVTGTFGNSSRGAALGVYSDLSEPVSVEFVQQRLTKKLSRKPLLVGNAERPIRRLAWCTGGAQDMLIDAINLGADGFISGEISERTTHLAREMGVAYFAAGHHATERYGVQALGQKISQQLNIAHEFVDDDNPV
jgi:dinuclear metal center YbgI/SA1388 family protein